MVRKDVYRSCSLFDDISDSWKCFDDMAIVENLLVWWDVEITLQYRTSGQVLVL